MQLDVEHLKDFIVDSGLVSREDISFASDEADRKNTTFGEELINSGKISENDYRRMVAYVLGIPFTSLQNQKIDLSILSIIPEPIARKHNIIAYNKSPTGDLEVAMLDPQDLEAIQFVEKKAGLRILARLTDVDSMRDALAQYQKSLKSEFGDIIASESKKIGKSDVRGLASDIALGVVSAESSEEDLKKLAEDIPIVRIVDSLLEHAILQGASDIHIEPFEKQLIIRYRIDGILHDAMLIPANAAPGIVARIKVLSRLRLDEKRLPQDGRFKIERAMNAGAGVSFRVSLLPTYYGEKVVMRLLPDSTNGYTLESLGFHGIGLEWLHEGMRKTTGIILATGPTGSGKTTTLYTMIDILNTPDVNISTIEDPIEYQMGRVNQTQVKPEIGLTFGQGLRALMRQDPNIIMVGEIRDKETAGLAINAALTGHLVLSTLHTNSSAGAIPRLVDMGVESFLLVSTLDVVIAQRLVRRLHKGEKYFLSPVELGKLAKTVDLDRVLAMLKEEKIVDPNTTWDKVPFFKPKSSPEVPDGYKGRIGIHEVLKVTSAIKDFVIKGATSEQIEVEAKRAGMHMMVEDGIFKAVQGVTSIEEVLRVISE
ncbi:MAG: type II/IV secretion system protein [Candidatus Vogelbacteria bacterium]|nr:type II/IV secretion system protein [Candidatus Vogelbacteria bacterium]